MPCVAPDMGSGTSRSKVTTPVTPWSYSPEPDSPDHDRYHNQRRLNSAQRLDAIANLVAQQERFTGSAPHRVLSSPNGNGNDRDRDDGFPVPLYIQPSTPMRLELSDLQEIQDLQKTFDSLGIPETPIDEKEDRWIGVKDNEALKPMDVGRVFGPRSDEGIEGTGDRVSSTSSSSCSEPKPQGRLVKSSSKKAVSAPMNFFKWEPPRTAPSEEWVYYKKEIDGFDPDKFRSVNNNTKNVSNFLSAYHINPSGTRVDTPSHPHSVPDYDEAEERIVGSIEREYSY